MGERKKVTPISLGTIKKEILSEIEEKNIPVYFRSPLMAPTTLPTSNDEIRFCYLTILVNVILIRNGN